MLHILWLRVLLGLAVWAMLLAVFAAVGWLG